MSDTVCESSYKGPYKGALGGIEGETIVGVEIRNGGMENCDWAEIRLTGGKLLHLRAKIDMNSYGINPTIEYKVGGWSRWEPRKDKKTDCEGQLYFSFFNKS